MSAHRMDWDRGPRTGTTEAVLCDRKSTDQIAGILQTAKAAEKRLLLTCLSTSKAAVLARRGLYHDLVREMAIFGGLAPRPMATGVGIVAAGTSDMPIAAEAQRTLAFHDVSAPVTADVCVAGRWCLMDEIETLPQHRVLIAIAGVVDALFSVLAGLTRAPVIAVPASVGHRVAERGRLALHAALGSCTPGLVVLKTGNGFGASCAALRMLGAR